jgi:hypothetical protein
MVVCGVGGEQIADRLVRSVAHVYTYRRKYAGANRDWLIRKHGHMLGIPTPNRVNIEGDEAVQVSCGAFHTATVRKLAQSYSQPIDTRYSR